jgi:hypothetical protein
MKNKLKFGSWQYNWTFEDLIELKINLINKIRGLIEKISKFGDDSVTKF